MTGSELNLATALRADPDAGELHLGQGRVLLFRQEALAALRGLLIEQLGEDLARSILARFGYRCGAGDYAALADEIDGADDVPAARAVADLAAQEGLARIVLDHVEIDRGRGHLEIRGWWSGAYEVEFQQTSGGLAGSPVCHALAGYLSGFWSALLGRAVVVIETACVGCGDERCEFVARTADRWGPEADPWRAALAAGEYSLARDLEAKLAVIQEQESAISELSTPVMEIWDDVLVLPIVGVVDTRRSMEIMNNLLESIEATQARCVIIDVTGVEVVDTKTADYLLKVMRAANLLGSRCVLTGLSSAIAQTLVEIGANLSEVRTLRNIKEGLKDCLRYLKLEASRAG